MDVAHEDGTLRGGRAVAHVRLRKNASCREGARQPIKDGAEQQPPVVNDIGVLDGEDANKLVQKPSGRRHGQQASSAEPVRKVAKLGGNVCANAAGAQGQDEHEPRHASLYLGQLALGVVASEQDRRVCVVGVEEGLVRKVVLAHEIPDQVHPGHNDATRGEGGQREGKQKPVDLAVLLDSCRSIAGLGEAYRWHAPPRQAFEVSEAIPGVAALAVVVVVVVGGPVGASEQPRGLGRGALLDNSVACQGLGNTGAALGDAARSVHVGCRFVRVCGSRSLGAGSVGYTCPSQQQQGGVCVCYRTIAMADGRSADAPGGSESRCVPAVNPYCCHLGR
jgi:hypothetical protein